MSTTVDLNLLRSRNCYPLVNCSQTNFRVKPSLTPGLGTRRIVIPNRNHDSSVHFTVEPRAGDEAFQEWRTAMRKMARFGDGLPNFVRRRVWSTLADRQLNKQHVDWPHVVRLAFSKKLSQSDDILGTQIVKDLHRTGCEQFGSDADRAALKQVLLAYARWNKRVGYCQGFNVIAAAILDITERDEKDAFKIMVYLIDYVLPESYFAQNLQALSVDIAVFRSLLQSRLPRLADHLDYLQQKASLQLSVHTESPVKNIGTNGMTSTSYEPPLMNVYVIQWFLTLFATCLPQDAVIRIWDSIMLEGSEVILRTAVVIMDFLASRLMKAESADEFYCTMSDLMIAFAEGRIVSTRELCLEIYELAPFPYPNLKELREKFMYNITPLVLTTFSSLGIQKNTDHGKNGSKNGDREVSGKPALLNWWRRSSDTSRGTTLPMASWHKTIKQRSNCKSSLGALQTVKTVEVTHIPFWSEKYNRPNWLKNELEHGVSSSSQDENDTYEEVNLCTENVSSSCKSPHSSVTREALSMFTPEGLKLPFPMQTTYDNKSIQSEKSNLFSNEEKKMSPITKKNRYLSKFWNRSRSSPLETDHETVNNQGLRECFSDKPSENVGCVGQSGGNGDLEDGRYFASQTESKSSTRSDISKLGPGAVGECRQTINTTVPSKASCQSHMKNDLSQLKRLYRRQVAQQRDTTLRLPGLWSSETREGTFSFSNASVMAIMPQTRTAACVEDIIPAVSAHNDRKDEVHAHSDKIMFSEPLTANTSCTFHLKNNKKIIRPCIEDSHARGEVMKRKHDIFPFRESMDHVVGAVRSWQASAVWTSSPTSVPELRELPPDLDDPSSGYISPREMESHEKLLTTQTPKFHQLAAPCKLEPTNEPSPRDLFANFRSTHHKSASTSSVTPPPVTSEFIDLPTAFNTEYSYKLFNSDGVTSPESDTGSFYTCGSHFTDGKFPWENASNYFSLHRRAFGVRLPIPSITQQNQNATLLRLPLSKSQKAVGTQLGLYRADQSAKGWVSGFTDRLHFVEMSRSAQ